MMLQILNGFIEASWVITVLGAIVAFFLVRTLSRIEKRLEKQDQKDNLITKVLLQMLTRLGGDDAFYHELSKQLNQEE